MDRGEEDWPESLSELAGLLDLETPVGADLAAELDWIRFRVAPAADLVERPFRMAGRDAALLYMGGYGGSGALGEIGELILRPLQKAEKALSLEEMRLFLLPVGEVRILGRRDEILARLLRGEAVILAEGLTGAVACELAAGAKREVSEPRNEFVLRGPREGFIEDLGTNLSLIRRRLPTPDLKVEERIIGFHTRTRVAVVYLATEVSAPVLHEVRKRLAKVSYRGILEGTYLEEAIQDSALSPFPQVQKTERPDVVVGALLEGRVAILTDGAPATLVLPTTLVQFLSSPEDQYLRYNVASFGRWLRFLGVIVALVLPSLYILLTEFHVREILPLSFLLTLAGSHESVPLSISLETFVMSLIFDFIWQAGLRTPQPLGMAISVVGALVIGEATVRAGIFSAPTIVVVALSAVLSLLSPSFDALITNRILSYPLLLLSAVLGPFGFAAGLILLLMHLAALRSFGKPFFTPLGPFIPGDFRDVLFRLPHPFIDGRRGH